MCELSRIDLIILWSIVGLQMADPDSGLPLVRIAGTCGLSQRTVKEHLAELERRGFVAREASRSRGRPYVYTVLCRLPAANSL